MLALTLSCYSGRAAAQAADLFDWRTSDESKGGIGGLHSNQAMIDLSYVIKLAAGMSGNGIHV